MSSKLNIDKTLDKLDLQIIQSMMMDAEISYADLGKNITVIGAGDHIEIWNTEEWNKYFEKLSDSLTA